jgi:glutamate formiminotransferase
VSMNLVDVEVTGVRMAFDAVVEAAASRAIEVLDSEIVGLAPSAALPPGTGEHVRLTGFSPDRQILEELVEAG